MIQIKLNFALSLSILLFLFMISIKSYGYAEIHYTFWGYSLINRHAPEVILDAPWRVESGEPIPILCVVKDADRFPINLERITAKCKTEDGKIYTFNIPLESQSLNIAEHYWYKLDYIELPYKYAGKLQITLEAEFTRKGRRKIIISDNLSGLSHSPFSTFVSSDSLPSIDGWFYGDSHYHSDMTQDQVEFGAPVDVAVKMGKSIGLSWFAVTDHSYDLDIAIGQYFKRDPNHTRWQNIQDEIREANQKYLDFAVLPAEEVSCGNCRNHNVHLLAFNVPDFIPGSGDGVKNGLLYKKPDLTIQEVLKLIKDKGGFAYSAHPEIGNGFMGTLLLNRGHWHYKDLILEGSSGMQFWNGEFNPKFDHSRKTWINLLLEGRRTYLLGGNDAHGDFNRCRNVKYPNTILKENENHIFGKVRTFAKCENGISVSGVFDALKKGKTIVTNGPISILQVQNDNGKMVDVGGEISGRDFNLIIDSASSDEFGRIEKIDLYKGDLVNQTENIEKTFSPVRSDTNKHNFVHKIVYDNPCYVRLEAFSSANGRQYKCFSNPIWLL
ncbi:TPA: hypothetical protein ENS27_19630 [bacterium]|nr:hypothetical protein [bacterium]